MSTRIAPAPKPVVKAHPHTKPAAKPVHAHAKPQRPAHHHDHFEQPKHPARPQGLPIVFVDPGQTEFVGNGGGITPLKPQPVGVQGPYYPVERYVPPAPQLT